LPERRYSGQLLDIKNLTPGTYYWSVQAVDNNYAGGAWAAENTFTISGTPSAIIDISGHESLLVFPNPASTSFEVNLKSKVNGKAIICLYNSFGIKIQEYQSEKLNTELNFKIPVTGLKMGSI